MDIIFSMNLIKRAFTVATDNCTLFDVLGTWSGVVAASVVAVIYHRQLREMQKQLKVMQQATRVAALPSLSHLVSCPGNMLDIYG